MTSCNFQNIKSRLLLSLSSVVTLKIFEFCYFVHREYLCFLYLSYVTSVISLSIIKQKVILFFFVNGEVICSLCCRNWSFIFIYIYLNFQRIQLIPSGNVVLGVMESEQQGWQELGRIAFKIIVPRRVFCARLVSNCRTAFSPEHLN